MFNLHLVIVHLNLLELDRFKTRNENTQVVTVWLAAYYTHVPREVLCPAQPNLDAIHLLFFCIKAFQRKNEICHINTYINTYIVSVGNATN